VVLPKELATRAFEGTQSIDELRGLGIAWDRALQGRVKTLLTVPNPQYHLTNLYGDTFNAWLGQNAPQLARNLGTSARVLSRQAKTGGRRGICSAPRGRATRPSGSGSGRCRSTS
jgi:hypothetical protein